jgi:hypothetical protein
MTHKAVGADYLQKFKLKMSVEKYIMKHGYLQKKPNNVINTLAGKIEIIAKHQ